MKILERVGIILQYSSSFNKANSPDSQNKKQNSAPQILLFDTEFRKNLVNPLKEQETKDQLKHLFKFD